MIEIKNRWTGAVIFSADVETLKDAVVMAVGTDADLTRADLTDADLTDADLTRARLTGADLTGADLTGADLTRARLTDADLTDADLTDADLTGADLTRADLTDADLTDADLTRARLTGADLTGADLTGADLTRARLTDADLTGADLTGADLTGADLTKAKLYLIKESIWGILSAAPAEAQGVRSALLEGRVDGSTYSGPCCCLVGTIANLRHVSVESISCIVPDSGRPAERWFMGIRKGDTPENNQIARITAQWIDEWLHNVRSAFDSSYEPEVA